jgi:hypothetical protein
MWIDDTKDTFLLRNLPFQAGLLSDPNAYKDAVFGVAESSFHHVDLFKNSLKNLETMYVYTFSEDQTVELNKESYSVSFGDCLISLYEIKGMPTKNFINFYYNFIC